MPWSKQFGALPADLGPRDRIVTLIQELLNLNKARRAAALSAPAGDTASQALHSERGVSARQELVQLLQLYRTQMSPTATSTTGSTIL